MSANGSAGISLAPRRYGKGSATSRPAFRPALAGAGFKPTSTPVFRAVAPAVLLALLSLTGCADAPSILDPQGPGAARINLLWWVMLGMAAGVFVLVEGLLLYAVLRYRRNRPEGEPEQVYSNMLVEASAAAFPTVVLTALFVVTFMTLAALAEPPEPEEFTIQVIGHQWWWEVRYPEQGVVTANEVHIPAGRPVRIEVTSRDVIHSFWAPQLQGKVDMIPGRTNITWLQADQPGIFRGHCTEFCGLQHSNMAFHVVAHAPEDMEAWFQQQNQPARPPPEPLEQQGMELFALYGCPVCHTVRGTPARGILGPDLTHVGSREWIAAGTLENTPENLVRWISRNQEVKPGNAMPQFALPDDALWAIAAYLSSLDPSDQSESGSDAD